MTTDDTTPTPPTPEPGPADQPTQELPAPEATTNPASAAAAPGQPGYPGTPTAGGAVPPVPPPGTAPVAQPARSPRRRALWIAGASVVGLVLLAGAVGLGVAIGNRDNDRTVVYRHDQMSHTGQGQTGGSMNRGMGPGATDDSTSGGYMGGRGSSDSETQDSSSSSDTSDDATDIELTGDTLDSAVSAAMEASGGHGVVIDAETSDDPTHAYEVTLRRGSGEEMTVYLDADFQVVATESWHS